MQAHVHQTSFQSRAFVDTFVDTLEHMFVDMFLMYKESCAMETTTRVAGSFITTVLVVQSSDSGSVLAFCSFLLRVQFDLLATPYTSLSPACHVRFWRVWFREADSKRGIGRVAGLDSCGTDRHDSSTQWPTHSTQAQIMRCAPPWPRRTTRSCLAS